MTGRSRPVLAVAVLLACTPGAVSAPAGAAPPPASPGATRVARPVSAEPIAAPDDVRRSADCAVTLPSSVTDEPSGHRLLGIADAHRFSRGAGVTVAVIDTGVTPHPRLPRVRGGGDYVGDGDGRGDCDAHGTLVAGIIAGRASPGDAFVGVAPDAAILAIRQSSGAYARTDGDRRRPTPTVGAGYGPVDTLARAVVRAVDLGAGVVNISEVACAAAGTRLDDTRLRSALQYARTRDAVVVVAAGNLTPGGASGPCGDQNPGAAASPQDALQRLRTVVTPARLAPLVLTVGAVSAADGSPADFSLRGPWVGVAAPGTDVVAPDGTGRLTGSLRTPDGPMPLAGAGYAAPYVAGLAALVRSRFPDLRADQVVDRIVRTAHGGGRDAAVGAGVIDPTAALTADLSDSADRTAAGTPIPLVQAPDDPASGTGIAIGAVVLGAAVLGAAGIVAARSRRTAVTEPAQRTR
ncbi:type VII secretion-associated serine protease mycosin [Gordonia shandongensis]|uniref:type VII secretion-associated serine protease mycosin n=1 Tax=Gordonia shandongensis TaxID=376351 RepID=UPI00042A7D35|nr:type VII secretion-associated serine protease mycosin [Gordonia shandongensis]